MTKAKPKKPPQRYAMTCPYTGCERVGRRLWGNYCSEHQKMRPQFKRRVENGRCPYHGIPLIQLAGDVAGCPRKDCKYTGPIPKKLATMPVTKRVTAPAERRTTLYPPELKPANTPVAVIYPDNDGELVAHVSIGLPAAMTFIEKELSAQQMANASVWTELGKLKFVAQVEIFEK